MKITVSTTYDVIWQLKDHTHYKFTKDGICINSKRNKIVKRVKNGGSIGYCISGKFYSLTSLRNELEKIVKIECPF
jgi:hypothetical protein